MFRENISRDMWNWREAMSISGYGIDWKQFLPESFSSDAVRDENRLRSYLEQQYYLPGKVSEFKSWMEQHINAEEIAADLETLMGRAFTPGPITVFLTTFHRAPYDVSGRFFYSIIRSYKREVSITSVYHELMHFLFHWHYWETCRSAGLSDTQIHVLKESLTVLLNPILDRRGLPHDNGYPSHQAFRTIWATTWLENRTFVSFLETALRRYASMVAQ